MTWDLHHEPFRYEPSESAGWYAAGADVAKEKGKTVIDESAEKFVKVTREDQAAGRVLTAVERGVYQLPGNSPYSLRI